MGKIRDQLSKKSIFAEHPKPTKRQYEICRFYISKAMLRWFGYDKSMSNDNVIGPNGERIYPPSGAIAIPKTTKIRRTK